MHPWSLNYNPISRSSTPRNSRPTFDKTFLIKLYAFIKKKFSKLKEKASSKYFSRSLALRLKLKLKSSTVEMEWKNILSGGSFPESETCADGLLMKIVKLSSGWNSGRNVSRPGKFNKCLRVEKILFKKVFVVYDFRTFLAQKSFKSLLIFFNFSTSALSFSTSLLLDPFTAFTWLVVVALLLEKMSGSSR